ncbi:methylated-DNA--[protein]-cysteine S-methyltransferase [Pseudomonas sp. Marseille-QA0892]
MYFTYYESPVGRFLLVHNGHALLVCSPEGSRYHHVREDWKYDPNPLLETIEQLDEYFEGKRQAFSLCCAPLAGTAFQRLVWQAVSEIRYGSTETYGAVATRIGRPTAARAVGAANGRNPLCLVVPCHRVIGSAGLLTGYAGGIDQKTALLAHERAIQPF